MNDPLARLRTSSAVIPAHVATPPPASFDLSLDDFAKPPAAPVEPQTNAAKPGFTDAGGHAVQIESVAKFTVERMLREAGIEEPFTFNVPAGRADSYFNNMSQTISRARKRLKAERKKIVEFRLVHVATKRTKHGYDMVTVKRVRPGNSMRDSDVYQELDRLLVLEQG